MAICVGQYQPLPGGNGLKLTITQASKPISYGQVIQGWRQDRAFRNGFIELLAQVPFAAFRWETPAIAKNTADQPFECVILPSPDLAKDPDQQTFANHFQAGQPVVTFSNLGQDAILVVPCPNHPGDDYSHLGAFIKHAPQKQQQALWQAVGQAMAQRLGLSPVWLNTAGGGVAWLHIRLDDAPKYYHHSPYGTAH